MKPAQEILLGDAREALLRIVRSFKGLDDHREAFAAWLLGTFCAELQIENPCRNAVSRPIGQKNYRDVATLGYAAATLGADFSHSVLLQERLTWLAGRDTSMAGNPAGFSTDALALLGTALGAHTVGGRQLIEKVSSWMGSFAMVSFNHSRASDYEKYLVAAALRLVGSPLTLSLPGSDETAAIRVALRIRGLLPPVHQSVAETDAASTLRLMLDSPEGLDPLGSALRLAAYEEVRRNVHSKTAPSFALTSSDASHVGAPTTAFISYAWELDEDHNESALALANSLRGTGIDAMIDRYVYGTPEEGWPIWMLHQIKRANFVLIVCTETYRRRCERNEAAGVGKGAKWEGAIITQSIYEDDTNNRRFVPVIFKSADAAHIPLMLKSATHYDLANKAQFEKLYRYLTNQPLIVVPPLGSQVMLQPRDVKPFKSRP